MDASDSVLEAVDPPELEVIRELGRGALGRVELVRLLKRFEDLPEGTELVRKRLLPEVADDPRARASLESEAEISARASHPSLIFVLGFGDDEEGPFLLTRYVPGRSLRDVLHERGPLPEPLARRIGCDLAGALRALHAAGFVHGDMKPENIRLDEEDRAVLLDLGLARSANAIADAVAGSLPYLSPERLRGGGPSTSSDVFALGVVLFELGTAEHPFASTLLNERGDPRTGASGERLLELQQAAIFDAPSSIVPELSPLFDRVSRALLDRRPAARPSAEAALRILTDGESGDWWRQRLDDASARGTSDLWISVGSNALPVVGRARELQSLERAWRRSLEEQYGGIALVRGGAGSGRSRLLLAFAEHIRTTERPPLVLSARCSNRSERQPFGTPILLVRHWLRLPDDTPPSARDERRLREILPPRDADTLVGALDPDSTESLGGSVSLALARWAAELSQRRPLLIIVDDVDRARTSTLTALARLASALKSSASLLALTLDPALEPARARTFAALLNRLSQRTAGGVLEIELGPIHLDAVRELVAKRFHPSVPRTRLAQVLMNRTHGNPGQIDELLTDLIERGLALEPDGGGLWHLTIEPDALPEPRSITESVGDRLARLELSDRRWLERICVLHDDFNATVLGEIFSGAPKPAIDAALVELAQRGWIEASGNTYAVASRVYRRTVIDALDPDRRRRLHRLIVRWLKADDQVRSSPGSAYALAYHLRRADQHRAFIDLVLELIETMERRGSPQRVLRLARWGLASLDSLPATPHLERLELQLLEIGADAADRFGNRARERELLDRLVSRDVDAAEDPALAARTLLLHARYSEALGQTTIAVSLLNQAADFADASGDARLVSEARRRLARALAMVGHFAEARAEVTTALESAAGPHQAARAQFARAQIETLDDGLETALEALDQGTAMLRDVEPEPLGLLGAALLLRARLMRSFGKPTRALGAAKRALELTRQSGERRFEAQALARVGGLLFELGRLDEAEAELREAELLAREIEDPHAGCLTALALSATLRARGRDDAKQATARALRLARDVSYGRGESLALALRAREHLGEHKLEAALVDSAQARDLLDSYGAELFDSIQIIGTRAAVLARANEARESAREVEELQRRIEEIGAGISSTALAESLLDSSRANLAYTLGGDSAAASS